MIIALCVLCLILSAFLVLSVRRNMSYMETIENTAEQVQTSLDVLDECYRRASDRAALEVMSDEPVIREMVKDLKDSRDAILLVANLIVKPFQTDEDDEDE